MLVTLFSPFTDTRFLTIYQFSSSIVTLLIYEIDSLILPGYKIEIKFNQNLIGNISFKGGKKYKSINNLKQTHC